jgi:hypothetical protein
MGAWIAGATGSVGGVGGEIVGGEMPTDDSVGLTG